MKKTFLFLFVCLFPFFTFMITNAFSDVIELHVPFVTDTPKQNLYYHELLEKAVTEAGHTPKLIVKKMSQLRIKLYMDDGKISIYWMVESTERNNRYIPINVGITDGLIGKRILFIKKGDQHLYDNVNTLDDFRKLGLTGGMGKGWFDVKVWKANNLRYREQDGNWKSIFNKIPLGRSYNYFSRGLNEIIVESREHPDLDIEKRLALIYERDFRFYLSKTGENAGAKYKDILDDSFEKAKKSGLLERLVRKYWANDFEALNYDKRIKINLTTPK